VNVFVLCTGRCGSRAFIRACRRSTNFSAGHETRLRRLGPDRFAYPVNHIEADNRLSWLLGRLDVAYGDSAAYVHLMRDEEATALSLLVRYSHNIMAAYHKAHPEVLRAKGNAYRARARAAEGQFTSAEWTALVTRYDGKCAYRGEVGPIQVDHRTPLSRGGANSIDNILPACRKCNTEKGQLTEAEFRARLAAEQGQPRP